MEKIRSYPAACDIEDACHNAKSNPYVAADEKHGETGEVGNKVDGLGRVLSTSTATTGSVASMNAMRKALSATSARLDPANDPTKPHATPTATYRFTI